MKAKGMNTMLKKLATCLFLFVQLNCGDAASTGNVQVFVQAEDTIVDGLTPGTDEESIRDGWTVTYTKFLINIGHFRGGRAEQFRDELSQNETYVLNMKDLPAGGFQLASFKDVDAERWARVGYDMPRADATSICASGVSDLDCAMMQDNGYSLYFEAELTKDGEEAVTLFWHSDTGTSFDDCMSETGIPGFSVPSGGTVAVEPTIHGDHWFFTNITQGSEITERRAQWIADSDVNHDGEVTVDELQSVDAVDVFSDDLYNLTGALLPIETAFDYLAAQSRTLGDYQGEGECPTRTILE